jgi:hypothetical protein
MSYLTVRRMLLHQGWKARKTSFNFDQNHEIVCGSAGLCGANFWKDWQGKRCIIDFDVEEIKGHWVVSGQDLGSMPLDK